MTLNAFCDVLISHVTSPVNAYGVGLGEDTVREALHGPRQNARTMHQIFSFGVPAPRQSNQATQTPIPIHTLTWEDSMGTLAGEAASSLDKTTELMEKLDLERKRRYREWQEKEEKEWQERQRRKREEEEAKATNEMLEEGNGKVEKGKEKEEQEKEKGKNEKGEKQKEKKSE